MDQARDPSPRSPARKGRKLELTRAEVVPASLAALSWTVWFLAVTDRLGLGRTAELVITGLTFALSMWTLVVSSRQHAAGPRPRSPIARGVVWAVIIVGLAWIAFLVLLLLLAAAFRDFTF